MPLNVLSLGPARSAKHMKWTGRQKKATKVAVIGLGVFGSSLALALKQGGCEVLGIDSDAMRAKRLSQQIHCATVDTTSEEALRDVAITTYGAVVVAIDNDFENSVLTTAALKSLGMRRIICQSSNDHEREILRRVGADQVVEPDSEAAHQLARELLVGELENLPLGQKQSVLKVRVPQHLAGRCLADLFADSSIKVRMLAIQRGNTSITWPPARTPWLAGDYLVVLGEEEALASLRELF